MKSKKGGAFEREICKQLSRWWTNGVRDDVFWRTSASGARATQRRKVGKATFGQYGDVQAVDPLGAPLMCVASIELKRGYSKTTFADTLDRSKTAKQQQWEAFVDQAEVGHALSGSLTWFLIQRRDKRQAVIFMPRSFYRVLKDELQLKTPCPFVQMSLLMRTEKLPKRREICAILLDDFFSLVSPKAIQSIADEFTK